MSLVTDYVIKTGDLGPPIDAICRDGTGAIVNLTGATGVRFIMRSNDDPSGVPKVAAAGSIIGLATDGHVRYTWVAANVDTAGLYDAEFEVTFAGPAPQTFPNDRQIVILITPDLD